MTGRRRWLLVLGLGAALAGLGLLALSLTSNATIAAIESADEPERPRAARRDEPVVAAPAPSPTTATAERAEPERLERAASPTRNRLRFRLEADGPLPADDSITVTYGTARGYASRGRIRPRLDGRFELETVARAPRFETLDAIGAFLGSLQSGSTQSDWTRGPTPQTVAALDHVRRFLDRVFEARPDGQPKMVTLFDHVMLARCASDGSVTVDTLTSPVDAKGRIPVADGSNVWITVAGRFVLQAEPQRFPIALPIAQANDDEERVVSVRLGARLHGALVGPRGLVQRALAHEPQLRVEHEGLERTVELNQHGRFDAGPFPPETRLRLSFESPACRPFTSEPLELVAGESHYVAVPIAAGVLVTGQLLSATGAELAMHTIAARVETPAGDVHETSARTDRHGRFELAGLPPGDVRVRLKSPHMTARVLELGPRNDGEVVANLELRARLAGRIAGQLLGADGQPVQGRSIEAFDPQSAELVAQTFTDPEGRFTLQGLTGNTVELRASGTDEWLGRLEVRQPAATGSRGVLLRLAPASPKD